MVVISKKQKQVSGHFQMSPWWPESLMLIHHDFFFSQILVYFITYVPTCCSLSLEQGSA
jgi:hypothetical protein